MARRKPKQLGLVFKTWGGARKGAGRKPAGRPGVPHRKRVRIKGRDPLHVTLRVGEKVINLRLLRVFQPVKKALRKACARFGFRLVQFSVQRNHLHFVAEAADWKALSRGVKGLEVRVARIVNRVMNRTGRVFDDRYHARELKKPLEVRNALVYVLNNARKHGGVAPRAKDRWVDPCSSGAWFDGWQESPVTPDEEAPVAAPTTWLLRVGWRRHGSISFWELPAT